MLYCDDPLAKSRRACRTVMSEVFNRLMAWRAPICVTAEEAWQSRRSDIVTNSFEEL